jgi:hypothetical protein
MGLCLYQVIFVSRLSISGAVAAAATYTIIVIVANPYRSLAQSTPLPSLIGGDQTLLTSSSIATLLRPADPQGYPPIYEYDQAVHNHSSQEIRDVYWRVAGFWRSSVPAGSEIRQQTPIPGLLQVPPPSGPLHYGPGSAFFDTSAYGPKDGFPSFKSGKIDNLHGKQTLSSTLQVAVANQNRTEVSVLRLTSSISSSSNRETVDFTYNFQNEGKYARLLVFWDIPRSESFDKALGITKEQPLPVEPEQGISRTVTSDHVPALACSTVFIFDEHNAVIARGIVAVFGEAEGRTTTSFSDFWPKRGNE